MKDEEEKTIVAKPTVLSNGKNKITSTIPFCVSCGVIAENKGVMCCTHYDEDGNSPSLYLYQCPTCKTIETFDYPLERNDPKELKKYGWKPVKQPPYA